MGDDDEPLGDPDEARGIGAAAGVGGAAGAFAWLNRNQMANAIDGVSPATGRGFVLGVLWCIGFAAVFAVGRIAVPAWENAWGLIALVVMIAVAAVWRRAFSPPTD